MSSNRGFRYGDNRTNSSYQRPMQRASNISPWEGGVVPNSRPSNSMSQGLLALPTQQINQGSRELLSAQQLALANTLLTSLGMNVISSQQQQQQQQQQQRLAQQLQFQKTGNDNLPTFMGQMGRSQLNMMGNGQPPFRQQGQNNYKFHNNNTGDRFRGMDAMRNRLHQNMTNNRVEPYSKNRPQQSSLQQQQQQRRTFVNKPRVDRKPTATFTKQSTPAVPEAAGQASKFRKPVKEVASSESESKEQEVASKTIDESLKMAPIILSDGDLANSGTREDEEVDAKRDWKDEKKDDVTEKVVDPVLPTAVKDELDTSIVKASEETIVTDTAQEEKVKSYVFQCHICNVTLLNETLLQEHIKLETHKTLMEKTSESYQAQAAALRLNMQEAYGRIDTMKRHNRHAEHREFCKMCKLNFAGSIASHRKLKEHLQLKTFLHPRCLTCSKEFTTRIEWDIHKLTVAHQISIQQEQAASLGKTEEKVENASLSPEKKDKEVERKGYQPHRVYGYHYVSEGFYCRVCEKFFDKRPLSRAHLQSKEHYDLCIAFEASEKEKKMNSKSTDASTELASATKESTNADNNQEAKPTVMETDVKAEPESEGNECKRQKLSENGEEEANTTVCTKLASEACNTETEQMKQEEENLAMSTENDDVELDETSIAGYLLEDDINMILDESGLDLGANSKGEKSDEKVESVKSSPKARRGGRAVRGRKRK